MISHIRTIITGRTITRLHTPIRTRIGADIGVAMIGAIMGMVSTVAVSTEMVSTVVAASMGAVGSTVAAVPAVVGSTAAADTAGDNA